MIATPPPEPPLRRNPVWLVLAAGGALAFWLALDYPLGSARNIGSAVFPLALSSIIVVVSLVGFVVGQREYRGRIEARPFLAVCGAVVVFILLIERAGMVPGVLLSMLVAYTGQSEGGYAGFVFYATLFAVGCWALFSRLLGVPVPFIGS